MNLVSYDFVDNAFATLALSFLGALGIFALLIAAGAVAAYYVSCALNQKTTLTGLMDMSLTLNQFPEAGQGAGCTRLDCGSFLICMADPEKIRPDVRLDPPLNWWQRAFCRRYDVGILLRRYLNAFNLAGFAAEPVSALLEKLAAGDASASLGQVFYRKKQLLADTLLKVSYYEAQPNKLAIYLDIPKTIDQQPQTLAGLPVKNLRITLEYHE